MENTCPVSWRCKKKVREEKAKALETIRLEAANLKAGGFW